MKEIIKTLYLRGYDIYIVGGAVRDYLQNIKPHDIDLVTNCTPTELNLMFKHRKVDTVGSQFRVTMIDGIEVATYRKDVYDNKGNLYIAPAKTLREDLARRDFTINAMAIHPKSGDIIDYYNGQSDLENKIIRFVGDPEQRILEDPLRIIRACRFKAAINGIFDGNTLAYIKKHALKALPYIPVERIRIEIMKAMHIKKASVFFHALHDIGILSKIFPSMESCYDIDGGKYHAEDVFHHLMLAGDYIKTSCPITKLAAYLHDAGKGLVVTLKDDNNVFYEHAKKGAEAVKKELTMLKFSDKDIKYITKMIELHMDFINTYSSEKGTRRALAKLQSFPILIESMVRLKIADNNANKRKEAVTFSWIKNILNKIDKELTRDVSIFKLAIDGHDVMRILDIKPCKKVGEILKALHEQVVDNPLLNQRYLLIDLIKEV